MPLVIMDVNPITSRVLATAGFCIANISQENLSKYILALLHRSFVSTIIYLQMKQLLIYHCLYSDPHCCEMEDRATL